MLVPVMWGKAIVCSWRKNFASQKTQDLKTRTSNLTFSEMLSVPLTGGRNRPPPQKKTQTSDISGNKCGVTQCTYVTQRWHRCIGAVRGQFFNFEAKLYDLKLILPQSISNSVEDSQWTVILFVLQQVFQTLYKSWLKTLLLIRKINFKSHA